MNCAARSEPLALSTDAINDAKGLRFYFQSSTTYIQYRQNMYKEVTRYSSHSVCYTILKFQRIFSEETGASWAADGFVYWFKRACQRNHPSGYLHNTNLENEMSRSCWKPLCRGTQYVQQDHYWTCVAGLWAWNIWASDEEQESRWYNICEAPCWAARRVLSK